MVDFGFTLFKGPVELFEDVREVVEDSVLSHEVEHADVGFWASFGERSVAGVVLGR